MPTEKKTVKSFYIENLGCSKNQVDAEIMIASLIKKGWSFSDSPDDAACIIINTCGFIESAKKESIETTLSYRELYPGKKLLMAGCFAQRYGKDLQKELPEVDGVFGNRDPGRVPEIMDLLEGEEHALMIPSAGSTYFERDKLLSFPGTAFVKISEGCSHGCSYCAIPLIRGALRSRPADEIVREIASLLEKGVIEINLIAQDLAAFGTDRGGRSEFSGLLKEISKLKGDFWIRLLYIYPDNFPFEILETIKDDPRFLPYFDVPFQHADGKVLEAMGRKGNKKKYLELLSKIREVLPDPVIRSTFMIGFPGEGRKEREELLSFIAEAQLDWAGFFVYSREENTKAYRMRNAFSHNMAVRAAEKFLPLLEKKQEDITVKRMERFAGMEMDILVEENVEGDPFSFGRGFLQAPEVDGSTVILTDRVKPGDVVRCRIVRSNGIDLEALPADEV